MKKLWRVILILAPLAVPAGLQAQFTWKTEMAALSTLAKYSGPGGSVNIPAAVNDLPVTAIDQNAF